MTKLLISGATALALTAMTAPAANALGIIFTETHDYGIGQYDPGGDDVLGDDFVTVSDQSKPRFKDAFDLSGANLAAVERFDLTLTFSGAGPDWWWPSEHWFVRVPGSDSSFTGGTGSEKDYFWTLFDDGSSQTFALSVYTDFFGNGDAFANAVNASEFVFGFSENTDNFLHTDKFNLDSAKLDVIGAVPLPAGVWFLGGMTGLGLWAARRKSKA